MIQCIVGSFSKDREKCLNYQHVFLPLKKRGLFYDGEFKNNTTHILFIDLPENALNMVEYLKHHKSMGVKLIYSFYDEARFPTIDRLIQLNLVDKLIMHDMQYKDTYPITTYITDYFVNEDLFPEKKQPINNGKKCYFGHLLYGRNLPLNVDVIGKYNTPYVELYKILQNYKGCIVFDTGKAAYSNKIIHHNKMKALESLMCGVNAYCQKGVNTLNYNKYLQPFDGEDDINIDINVIRDINNKVINDFIYEVIN